MLKVLALGSGEAGVQFDLRHCGVPAILVRGNRCEQVLLGRGGAAVRLDVVSGSLLYGPVGLVHDLATAEDPAIGALRRFLHLCRAGRLPAYCPPASQRFRRQAIALRVADALAQGASIREVGVMLYGADRVRDEWTDEALKSQCRRLITLARAMAGGGHFSLLQS